MALSNVDEAYYYRLKAGGSVLSLAEVKDALVRKNIRLRGVNFYYGINDENVSRFAVDKKALNDTHRAFFKRTVDDLLANPFTRMTVVLGLQPPKFFDRFKNPEPHAGAPFPHVMTQTALLKALAAEMLEYKALASAGGKTLRIIIRYASEMNDVRVNSKNEKINAWGQQPLLFKSSFIMVRDTMMSIDPELEFAFSPAIRRDLHPKVRKEIFPIDKYYPGDAHVDIVSGTWYVGNVKDDLELSTNLLSLHLLHYVHDNVLFGLDEVAGYDAGDVNDPLGPCDPTLKLMMAKIKALGTMGVHLDYVTFFMQNGSVRPWSRAKLSFV